MSVVEDNHASGCFELPIDGSHEIGAAYYRMDRDRFVLTHTIVPEGFSGKRHVFTTAGARRVR